jgi:hypothetical protein
VETGADAIGARVELRWEAPRPHWLSDELLGMLGAFAPSEQSMQLDEPLCFSSSAFSVKVAALRAIGYFSPFLSKRIDLPACAEVREMCLRLLEMGYRLWYEPAALGYSRGDDRYRRLMAKHARAAPGNAARAGTPVDAPEPGHHRLHAPARLALPR